MQVECAYLTERQSNQPYIRSNADRRIRPPKDVDVHTITTGVLHVLGPIVANWAALKNSRYDESDAEEYVENGRTP